jgi:hypothetical protein
MTNNPLALFFIFSTHFIEDRWSLAKYLIWGKNQILSGFKYPRFKDCSVTGYYDDWLNYAATNDVRPKFITTWLYIITDNSLHLACNYFALEFIKTI